MKEFIEKLIGRLEKFQEISKVKGIYGEYRAYSNAIQIVNQLAEEYNNGWILCSERLPEEYGEYFIWWTDITEKEYCEISEFHPEEGWIGNIPQAFSGKYTVIAWRELPGPFKRKGE